MSGCRNAGDRHRAVQSCPRRRPVGACDEPTARRSGQLVSNARIGLKSPTDSLEEPFFLMFVAIGLIWVFPGIVTVLPARM